MTLIELLQLLRSKDAFIVHCARSARGGELEDKPLYPHDLKATIRDLETGGVRHVSCSVIWPSHQETYGEIGVIVRPRIVDEIVRLSHRDAGTLGDGQGSGQSLSSEAVAQTFTDSTDYNEWLLTGGEVVGIFLNFAMELRVARLMNTLPGMSSEEAEAIGFTPGPYPVVISAAEIAADFPGLRLFGFVEGELREIGLDGKPTAAAYPY